jgi:hypothetical protein
MLYTETTEPPYNFVQLFWQSKKCELKVNNLFIRFKVNVLKRKFVSKYKQMKRINDICEKYETIEYQANKIQIRFIVLRSK